MVLGLRTFFFLFSLSYSSISLGVDKNFIQQIQIQKNSEIPYIQTRFIKSTDLKLESKGVLSVLDKEIRWKQTHPFTHIITMQNGIMSAGSKDSSKEVNNPIAKKMASIMFDLFKGNLEKLKTVFELKRKQPDINLLLIPKDIAFGKFIKSIKLSGKKRVETFYLEEKSGNSLTIKFLSAKPIKRL